MNKFKGIRGITLISLVITIIVLIILAGITLNMLLGENGIINKVTTSKEKHQAASDKENKILEEYYSKLLLADNSGTSLENIDMTTLKQLILDSTYPVGSVYMSMSSANPATTLGGQWERIGEGKTIVGEGTNDGYTFQVNGEQTTVGATTNPKGEYTHQLSVDEMPSHTHNFSNTNSPNIYLRSTYGGGGSDGVVPWQPSSSTTYTLQNTGGDDSHNNIQPYIVTYMWKRIL